MLRYSLYALFLGLTASVCAEALLNKAPGKLTLDEIEENLQVRLDTQGLPSLTDRHAEMRFCRVARGAQNPHITLSDFLDEPTIYNPLPVFLSGHQLTSGDCLHLWPTQLPSSIMSSEYRPIEPQRHGSICRGRPAG